MPRWERAGVKVAAAPADRVHIIQVHARAMGDPGSARQDKQVKESRFRALGTQEKGL